MSNKITVVAVVLDTRQLTLYKEDGSKEVILQGDSRIQRIIDEAVPALKKPGSRVVIDLHQKGDDNTLHNPYQAMEEETGGIVKFFRVAKKALTKFFGAEEEPAKPQVVAPVSAGQIPSPPAPIPSSFAGAHFAESAPTAQEESVGEDSEPDTEAEPDEHDKRFAEVMQHAVPASSHSFITPELNQGKVVEEAKDTVVAVVDGQLIPGIEALAPQFQNSILKMGSVIGVTNFLKRCAAIMKKRRHSVQDLLKFMERGDMPIADDGSIIIYKILLKNTKGKYVIDDATHGHFDYVDCHSKRVPQRVGSYVFMATSLVDHDRRNECSNGLHVARRGYLGGFSGDVCVMAKVNPEDVIAVPEYDANKMRVCGYHILYELPSAAFDVLRRDKAMTGHKEAAAMLQRAINGDHVGITDRVEITEQKGGGIIITSEKSSSERESDIDKNAADADGPLAEAIVLDPEETVPAPAVDPKAIASKQVQAKKQGKSLQQVAAADLHSKYVKAKGSAKSVAAKELMEFKRKSKVSWAKLGLPDLTEELNKQAKIEAAAKNLPKGKPAADKPSAIKGTGKHKDPQPQNLPKSSKKKEPSKADPAKLRTGSVKVTKTTAYKTKPAVMEGAISELKPASVGPAKRIADLLVSPLTPESAKEIVQIKKKAKKSWAALGVMNSAVINIEKLAK